MQTAGDGCTSISESDDGGGYNRGLGDSVGPDGGPDSDLGRKRESLRGYLRGVCGERILISRGPCNDDAMRKSREMRVVPLVDL